MLTGPLAIIPRAFTGDLISSQERIKLNWRPPVSLNMVLPPPPPHTHTNVVQDPICTVYVTCVMFTGGVERENDNRTNWCRVDDANSSHISAEMKDATVDWMT